MSLAVLAEPAEEKKAFFLPKSPAAAAYVLGRLSNQELTEAPRSEFVYVALLQRNGLERKYRVEALEGLAKTRNTSPVAELIRGISELDRKGQSGEATLRELGTMLLQHPQLAGHKPDLEKLATESQSSTARQIAAAAIITVDGTLETAWQAAESDPAKLANLVLSIPLIRDAKLRATAYSKVEPLLHRADSNELRAAAITAIAAVPGHEVETFTTLATLIKSEPDRPFAVNSLQRLPRDLWPKDKAEPLVKDLIAWLQSVPVDQRTKSEATAAFQLASDLASLLPAEAATPINRTLRALGVSVVVLRAVREQMLYDKSVIVVEAGKPVEIVLINDDAMPHNIVVITPGSLEEVGEAAEKMPATPDRNGRMYIPDSPKVLHGTRLVEPGQEVRLGFTAPETPGDYIYVCTFPGHWRRMVGRLAVVSDVEAFLAANPDIGKPKLTEWKLEDLVEDLNKTGPSRNTAAGKALFTQLACLQCHKLGGEGSNYGPDLTGSLEKWKGDRVAVLQQILEPSKVIEDRYRTVAFDMDDGEEVTGMILHEDTESVRIQSGPSESLIQSLKLSDIKGRKPQKSSIMPLGLLNALSKDQILDLLAFIEAGGKIGTHAHSH